MYKLPPNAWRSSWWELGSLFIFYTFYMKATSAANGAKALRLIHNTNRSCDMLMKLYR